MSKSNIATSMVALGLAAAGGGGGAVNSVNGKTGTVTLYGTDINMSTDTSLPTVTEQISSNKDNIGDLATQLGGKQDTLTAGSNITISNNTISATDTTYTAGTNITIDANNVISASGGGSSYTAGDGIEIANNTISLDDEYVEGMTVEGAYQLISNDGVLQDSSFISRTTGGSASISAEGTATLVRISGNSTNPTYVEEAWNDGGATVDHQVFAAKVTNGGSYTFTKVNDNWQLAGVNVDLSEYGITGVDALTEFTVVYTKANAGTIINATPTSFTSLGFNLYDHTNTRAYVIEGNRYQVFGTYTSVGTETIVDDYVVGSYTIPHSFVASTTGYVSVVGGNSTDTMIALVWSGYNYAHTYEAYDATTISFTDVTGWGMPRVNGVADEIDFEKQKYIKRIGRDVVANASLYSNKIVDSTYVYYVLSDAVETTVSYSKTYTANDFGEEIFAGTQVACELEVLYGQNLKDKLRTDVVTLSAQSLTTAQQDQVKTNLGITSGVSLEGIANGGTYSTNSITIGTNNTLNGSSGSNAENSLVVGNNNYTKYSNCLSAGKYLTNFADNSITFGDGGGKFYDQSGIVVNSVNSIAGGCVGTAYPNGNRIKVGGNSSIAIGYASSSSSTIETSAYASRALGYADGGYIKANGPGSTAMGYAKGSSGHLMASQNTGNKGSFAGGYANGQQLFADGEGSIAYGYVESATGYMLTYGKGANAFGWSTVAASDAQTAIGKCNERDNSSTYAFIIGNGTSASARSNALTVDWSGNLVCNNIPAPPSTDGDYVLKCSIVSGVATYSWTTA